MERGEIIPYSGAQRFLMCLNMGSNEGRFTRGSEGTISVYQGGSEKWQ